MAENITRPRGLGTIVHEVTNPSGGTSYPIVEDWEAEDAIPGGGVAASGRISLAEYRRFRQVYDQPSVWRTYLAESGHLIWSGRLVPAAVEGGYVRIGAKGPSVKAERDADWLMYMSRDLGAWFDVTASDLAIRDDAEDGSYTGSGLEHLWTQNLRAGSVRWTFHPHHLTSNSSKVAPPIAFWWPHTEGLSRFKARFFIDGHTGSKYRVEVRIADNVTVTNLLSWHSGTASIYDTTHTSPANGTIDVALDSSSEEANAVLLIVSGPESGGTVPTDGIHAEFNKVRVYGIAENDDFTASDLVKDLAGRIGVSDRLVQQNGADILPYELKESTYGEGLDYATMFTNWRWRFTPGGGAMDFAPWGERRTWTVREDAATMRLVPAERYNVVRVPYKYMNGVSLWESSVRAHPDPMPGIRNVFNAEALLDDPITGGQAQKPDKAERLGEAILPFVSSRRFDGDGTLYGEVEDRNYGPRSAHLVQAGDIINWQGHNALRVSRVRHTVDSVEVSFDSEPAGLRSLIARRRRRFILRHPRSA